MTWPIADVFREAMSILQTRASKPAAAALRRIRLVAVADTVKMAIAAFVLRKAHGRLGYPVEITQYPAELGLRLADADREDGDVQCIDGLDEQCTNFIQLAHQLF